MKFQVVYPGEYNDDGSTFYRVFDTLGEAIRERDSWNDATHGLAYIVTCYD